MKFYTVATIALLSLTACNPAPVGEVLGFGPEPTTTQYTPPAASGLAGVRPYPGREDVCQVIGDNAATAELLDDAALLIGCPKHETVAIAMRLREGAAVVAHARHWTLMSVPG